MIEEHDPVIVGATVLSTLFASLFQRGKKTKSEKASTVLFINGDSLDPADKSYGGDDHANTFVIIDAEEAEQICKENELILAGELKGDDMVKVERIKTLKAKLQSNDSEEVFNALSEINDLSVAVENEMIFRACDCLQAVVTLLSGQIKLILDEQPSFGYDVSNAALMCINNLVLVEDNNATIQNVIHAITEGLKCPKVHYSTKNNCMTVLTNMSFLAKYIDLFNSFIDNIVDQIFIGGQSLSALKILINLSKSDSGRVILESKIPNSLSFTPINHPLFNTDEAFNNWLTLLTNLSNVFTKLHDKPQELQKDQYMVDEQNKIRMKSLFFDKQRRSAIKQDLTVYLNTNNFREDRKELCDAAEYLRAKICTIDFLVKDSNNGW